MKRIPRKPPVVAKPVLTNKQKPPTRTIRRVSSPTPTKTSKRVVLATVRTKPKSKPPRTEAQYFAKPEQFKETWDRVLSVISKMRNDKVSLTLASRDAGISPRTVTRWGKTALQKRPNGKYAAKKSDDLLRMVVIPTPEGTRDIAVRGSKQVSLLAEYWNALHCYLQTGDASLLKNVPGQTN